MGTASTRRVRFSDEEKATARGNIDVALAAAGLLSEGLPACPICEKAERGKQKVFDDGVLRCHKCGWQGNAIDILGTTGWSFVDAVLFLTGRAPLGRKAPEVGNVASVVRTPGWPVTPRPDIYKTIFESGSLEAAVEFFSRWHISPEAVEEVGVVRIVDQRQLVNALKANFSPEEIIDAGVAKDDGKLLVSARYPICQPMTLPDGRIASIEFRGSEDTEDMVKAHKLYKQAKAEAEANGTKYRGKESRYVPKTISLALHRKRRDGDPETVPEPLKRASVSARCGFGLPRLWSLSPKDVQRIYIVEGCKDLLAARTMGLEAYGLPGAGTRPVAAVSERLASFPEIHVSLDADEAGDNAREAIVESLTAFGANAIDHPPPEGKDITDVLVDKHQNT